ncbi:MAG: type VI secretion system protein TssA [Desulfovibrionaceae bacterium]|nr:type VI secretion system protein TssA [Desulfovibrionaceae bacterium]
MADLSFETLGSTPVPGGEPAGEDARYEPEYAYILEEIEKLSFSGDGAPVSWSAIEKNAALILSEKSKDLQVSTYLGVALFHNKGMQGLLEGIYVLCGFLENFWESGWPPLKRIRGRVNALDWWHERACNFIQEALAQGQEASPQEHEALLNAASRLDELISSLMPDASPLNDLISGIRRIPLSMPEPEPEAAPAPTPSPEPPQAETPPQPEQTSPEAGVPSGAPKPEFPDTPQEVSVPTEPPAMPEADDPAALRRDFVKAAMDYLPSALRSNPADPVFWQLSRLIIWGGITTLPPAENGQTLLPPPDMDALARIRLKKENGMALDAALEAEEFFRIAPFCMDAHEIIYTALLASGPQFSEAARCVKDEGSRFFSRFPEMERLSFNDGAPFISPGTASWLRETTAGTGGNIMVTAGPGPCEAAFASARELAAQSKLNEALASLDAAKTDSPAVNLQIRVEQLHLLQENGKREASLALAESLLQELDRQNLDVWDPQLALPALLAVRRAFSASPADYPDQLADLRRRIVRICPSALG